MKKGKKLQSLEYKVILCKNFPVTEIGKYSSLLKLLRVTALVLRFIKNIKEKRAGGKVSTGNLEASDISKAVVN